MNEMLWAYTPFYRMGYVEKVAARAVNAHSRTKEAPAGKDSSKSFFFREG